MDRRRYGATGGSRRFGDIRQATTKFRQGQKGALMSMHKCFYSQLKAIALACVILGMIATSAAQQQSPSQAASDALTAPASTAPAKADPPPQALPENPVKIDFSKPRKSFPNLLAPYEGRTLSSPKVNNSPRIDQLIQDGKLMLSLNDAIALALENNLDLAIARYNLNIA